MIAYVLKEERKKKKVVISTYQLQSILLFNCYIPLAADKEID